MIKKFLEFILRLLGISFASTIGNEQDAEIQNSKKEIRIAYNQKQLMTESEYNFYLKLKVLEANYIIHPQICLASIVKKQSTEYIKYANELYRIIDFAIVSRDYREILLLIELNDSSHNTNKRKIRDMKVKKICEEIQIPLVTFYTKYQNKEEYVLNRIQTLLNKEN